MKQNLPSSTSIYDTKVSSVEPLRSRHLSSNALRSFIVVCCRKRRERVNEHQMWRSLRRTGITVISPFFPFRRSRKRPVGINFQQKAGMCMPLPSIDCNFRLSQTTDLSLCWTILQMTYMWSLTYVLHTSYT